MQNLRGPRGVEGGRPTCGKRPVPSRTCPPPSLAAAVAVGPGPPRPAEKLSHSDELGKAPGCLCEGRCWPWKCGPGPNRAPTSLMGTSAQPMAAPGKVGTHCGSLARFLPKIHWTETQIYSYCKKAKSLFDSKVRIFRRFSISEIETFLAALYRISHSDTVNPCAEKKRRGVKQL